jgi:hypothetical protein
VHGGNHKGQCRKRQKYDEREPAATMALGQLMRRRERRNAYPKSGHPCPQYRQKDHLS